MEALDLSLSIIMILFIAALAAGFIDTLVGGGGLITIPALMLAGVPPIFALGTNKLQATAGSGTASASLFLQGKVSFKQVRWLMACAFAGALLGSTLVQFVDASLLSIVIPVVIILIAVYFAIAPNQALSKREPRLSEARYGSTAVPIIGFYDGMFGPATGSFFVLAGVSLRGQQIVNATVIAKALNFATNLAALIVFISFGKVLWMLGGVMMVGQFIGAALGARVLIRINPATLRYLVIAVCVMILIAWGMQN